jgi:hypothetical protein
LHHLRELQEWKVGNMSPIKVSETYNVWIDWLEKQGKLVDEYEDRLDRCACESFDKGYKAAIEHQKEKQGEQTKIEALRTEYAKGRADAIAEMKPGEWSKEDSIRLKRIIDLLRHNRKGDTDTIYQQEQDIDWLNSLMFYKKWKPSDKQIIALSDVISLKVIRYDVLSELLDCLKKF